MHNYFQYKKVLAIANSIVKKFNDYVFRTKIGVFHKNAYF